MSARAVQGLKGTDLQHDHGNYLGSGKTTPRFEAMLCHFEIYPCCSGRSAVTIKGDADPGDGGRNILLSPFISKASRRVSSFFLRVQLSQPYVATGHTSAFISAFISRTFR